MENREVVVGTGSEFPGVDFEAKVRAAAAAEVEAAELLQTAKKKIGTIEQNRGLLELDGRDPEAEIRLVRAEVKAAEGKIQLTRQATQQLFADGRKQHDETKNTLWAAINDEVIVSHLAALRELSAKVNEALIATISLVATSEYAAAESPLTAGSSLSAKIAAFDAGTKVFSALAKEFRQSAQIPVPENESLATAVRETMERHIRQNLNVRKFEEMLATASSPQRAREFMKKSAGDGQ